LTVWLFKTSFSYVVTVSTPLSTVLLVVTFFPFMILVELLLLLTLIPPGPPIPPKELLNV